MMQRSWRGGASRTAIGSMFLVWSASAAAQSVPALPAAPAVDPAADKRSDDGIADIIVTAQRRSEKLQNVPIAVTALDGDALRTADVTSAIDLPKLVPGLSFNTQLGDLGLPRIRGVGIASGGGYAVRLMSCK